MSMVDNKSKMHLYVMGYIYILRLQICWAYSNMITFKNELYSFFFASAFIESMRCENMDT